jgi:hypothetical protein
MGQSLSSEGGLPELITVQEGQAGASAQDDGAFLRQVAELRHVRPAARVVYSAANALRGGVVADARLPRPLHCSRCPSCQAVWLIPAAAHGPRPLRQALSAVAAAVVPVSRIRFVHLF